MSKDLVKSTSTVVSMTMISRIAGFIRDFIMAQMFGAGVALDAFSIAFKIPNMIRQLFAEGSFSQAFVPVLAEYQKQATQSEMQRFINSMAGILGSILLLVTILGVIFAPWIIKLVAPGFTVGTPSFDWAVVILRITFPYLVFISLTAFAGAILNTYSRFWVAAFVPTLLNIFMIVASVWLAPRFHIPIYALAWSVLVAGVFQLWFLWYFLKPLNLFTHLSFNFHNTGVKKVFKLMLPALFGVSVSQINILLDTIFASFLTVGSVSWLYYSDRLMDVPLGIFGVAIATVILPQLSRSHATHSENHFSEILDWALRCVLLVGLPAAVILAIMSGPLLSTLFQHGYFNGSAVLMTSKSLTAFALGIVPFMLIKVLAAGFYAKQDMRTPVWIGVIAVLFNIIFNFTFIWSLAHAGIALSTSLAAVFNATFLYYFLRRSKMYNPCKGWMVFACRLLFVNALLAIFLWLSVNSIEAWISHLILWRSMHLLMLLFPAVVIYFVGLWLVGMRLDSVLIPGYQAASCIQFFSK